MSLFISKFLSTQLRFMRALRYAIALLIADLMNQMKIHVFYSQTTIPLAKRLAIKIPSNKMKYPYFVKVGFGVADGVRTTWNGLEIFFVELEKFLAAKDEYRIFNIGDEDGKDEYWKFLCIDDKLIRLDLASSFYGSHRDFTEPEIPYEAVKAYKGLLRKISE